MFLIAFFLFVFELDSHYSA